MLSKRECRKLACDCKTYFSICCHAKTLRLTIYFKAVLQTCLWKSSFVCECFCVFLTSELLACEEHWSLFYYSVVNYTTL